MNQKPKTYLNFCILFDYNNFTTNKIIILIFSLSLLIYGEQKETKTCNPDLRTSLM